LILRCLALFVEPVLVLFFGTITELRNSARRNRLSFVHSALVPSIKRNWKNQDTKLCLRRRKRSHLQLTENRRYRQPVSEP
jgi:hypothetical protein